MKKTISRNENLGRARLLPSRRWASNARLSGSFALPHPPLSTHFGARSTHCADYRRRGLTLFEVVLALSVLLVSVAALGQLISTGSRAAVTAQLRTEAVLRCESKLNEIVAGVEPLQSAADVPFDDQPEQWRWTLIIGDGPVDGLLYLQLTVNHVGTALAGNVAFTLERYTRDPQLFLDAAEYDTVQEMEE